VLDIAGGEFLSKFFTCSNFFDVSVLAILKEGVVNDFIILSLPQIGHDTNPLDFWYSNASIF
jgi:hypothetical protein